VQLPGLMGKNVLIGNLALASTVSYHREGGWSLPIDEHSVDECHADHGSRAIGLQHEFAPGLLSMNSSRPLG
jgi:hypothetical protein